MVGNIFSNNPRLTTSPAKQTSVILTEIWMKFIERSYVLKDFFLSIPLAIPFVLLTCVVLSLKMTSSMKKLVKKYCTMLLEGIRLEAFWTNYHTGDRTPTVAFYWNCRMLLLRSYRKRKMYSGSLVNLHLLL